MPAIDVQPSSPFLADGWEVSIDSGGSIEIDISAHGKDCITVFDPAENREYPQGAAKDGGRLEYVFESDEKSNSKSVTKEQVAEIAADIMTTFYGSRDSGVSNGAGAVLAGVILGHCQWSIHASI